MTIKHFELFVEWKSTTAHSWDISKNPVHTMWGSMVGEQEYGSKILSYLDKKEERFKGKVKMLKST